MADAVNAEELRENLKEYQEQLEQVEALLLDDPQNEEYQGIHAGLEEILNLTRELLKEATAQQQAAGAAEAAAPSAPAAPVAAITEAPEVRVPSVLPPHVAQQIRAAQQRAALQGQGPAAWAIGAKVQAQYSADDNWDDAVVTAVSVSGNLIVTFESYGTQQEVKLSDVREPAGGQGAEGTGARAYRGVEAPKLQKVSEEPTELGEMPKWLEIKPTDDEKTKQKKKKLIKSYKSKQRFQQMDVEQKQKADAWKNFIGGKGSKKKSGFITGRKKGSMFSTQEGSETKVGVVGSGKGMTQYGKRKRHEFGDGGEGSA